MGERGESDKGGPELTHPQRQYNRTRWERHAQDTSVLYKRAALTLPSNVPAWKAWLHAITISTTRSMERAVWAGARGYLLGTIFHLNEFDPYTGIGTC